MLNEYCSASFCFWVIKQLRVETFNAGSLWITVFFSDSRGFYFCGCFVIIVKMITMRQFKRFPGIDYGY